MIYTMKQQRLISHALIPEKIDITLQKIRQKIIEDTESTAECAHKLDLLNKLVQFDFGQYLLQNQGINGYWTHYMLMHPSLGRKTGKNNRGQAFTELETFLLDYAPTILATQQRFTIFLKENQKQVREGAKLASIPCGMMGELLYLDFTGIKNIKLVGIDYDPQTLAEANTLAAQRGLINFVSLIQQDAWQLAFQDELDLISSNGLNIYEPDNNKVTELYHQFYKALRMGGKLVTSFLTFPPLLQSDCEWDMSKIDQDHLHLQKIIFADIIAAKWHCFRSSAQMQQQLESAGFNRIEFIYDDARMFPTVVASK